MKSYIDIWDFVLLPFYLVIIYIIARYIKDKNINEHPEFKYFIYGLFASIFGSIFFCLIYNYYYGGGGDTIGYYISSKALNNLMYKNFGVYLSILSGHLTPENHSYFDSNTGYPWYWNDSQSFTTVRITSIFIIFGLKKFILTSVLIASVTYWGLWKLYRIFVNYFKDVNKLNIAIAVLFMPSTIFWGSGILKDSFTLAAAAWLVYSFFRIIIYKKNIIANVILIFFSIYILISIKPYIFFAIFAGLIIVLTYYILKNVRNSLIRIIILPIVFTIVMSLGGYILLTVSQTVGGAYSSIDNVVEKAYITQDDLKKDYYGGNSFDIGKFDPTLQGIMSKFVPAVVAGIYRPFLWESFSSPVTLLSGLETFFILIFSVIVFFKFLKVWIRKSLIFSIKIVLNNPLVFFSIIFSVTFAFIIGLTTANFGALVRYRIPLIPFYTTALFLLNSYFNKELEQNI